MAESGKVLIQIPAIARGERVCSYDEISRIVTFCGYSVDDAKVVQMNDMEVGFSLCLSIRAKEMLMFRGKNGILEYTIKQIAAAYERLGWKVHYIKSDDFRVTDIEWNKIQRVFSLNSIGWIFNGENYYDKLGIKSYNYIVDSPIYYEDSLKQAPKLGTLLCVDKKHVEYVKRFYKNINNAYFLPLGGDNGVLGIQDDWEKRKIEVLFVGCRKVDLNTVDFSEDEWDMLLKLLKNTDLLTESVLEQKIRGINPQIDEINLREKIWENRKIDICLVTYIRERVLQVLIEAGIDVNVYGNWEGWEYVNNPHFIQGGFLSQEEVLDKMKDSKIVLNVMPWFKDGIHDRVINAMLAGAVCLTDNSKWMSEMFDDREDYWSYSLKELEKLPQIVKKILKGNHDEMRMRAYKKADDGHRWFQRIEELERQIAIKEEEKILN